MPKLKYLIIAEKGEEAKAIARAIEQYKIWPESQYRIAFASGHLLEPQAPEDYDPKYKEWRLEDLPISFRHWKLVPKTYTSGGASVKKRLESIRSGLRWCDVVIHAGDPDDEGQLIVDEILDYLGNTKTVYRLDINDNTEEYIAKQLRHLRPNAPLRPIGRAAYAREVADLMFGINYTRYYSLVNKTSGPLSVGRVQTPTLGLVVARDRQIEGHIERTHFGLKATAIIVPKVTSASLDTFDMELVFDKNDPRLTDGLMLDRSEVGHIAAKLKSGRYTAEVTRKIVTESQPLPFNLAKLQAYCSTTYGLDPQTTQDITQALRSHTLITYNRSSCQYLHELQHKDAPVVLDSIFANLGISATVDTGIKSACFNDKYLVGEPHHAIIPTVKRFDLSVLSKAELAVYKAICLYYILQYMPERKREKTTAEIKLHDGSVLRAVAHKTLQAGWYGYLHPKYADSGSPLADAPVGPLSVIIGSTLVQQKKTAPPKRYSIASLIEDMTSVAKYVKDPEVKKILLQKDDGKVKENGSIGTPATRAGIVEKLIKRGYIVQEGSGKNSYIVSTELGRAFFDALPDTLKGLDITSSWWSITQDIQHGRVSEEALFDSVLSSIQAFMAAPPPAKPIKGLDRSGRPACDTPKIVGVCPRCGRAVIERPKSFSCSGWSDRAAPCDLTIWKSNTLLERSGKSVTAANARTLLAKGYFKVKLKSKRGTKYDAVFDLVDKGGKAYLRLRTHEDWDRA